MLDLAVVYAIVGAFGWGLCSGPPENSSRALNNDQLNEQSGSDASVVRRMPLDKSDVKLDHDVLEVVLGDLLAFDGTDSPVVVGGSPPEKILFAERVRQSSQTVDQVLFRHPENAWEKLTSSQINASREAAECLVRRIQKHNSFDDFAPQDKRIVIYKEQVNQTKGVSRRTRMDRVIQAWAPGYSKDKQLAVVRLFMVWGRHHMSGTYVLTWDNGKWSVCLR